MNPRKQKLIELSADKLSGGAKRVKAKLAGLSRTRRFRPCRESWAFARELEALLNEIRAGAADPLEGVRLVCAFYDSDAAVFEHCDDSNGYIGDVFSHTAKELFRDFAHQCEDKRAVADLVLQVNQRSGYGVREHLIECAGECLPSDIVRSMILELRGRADKANEEFEQHYAL